MTEQEEEENSDADAGCHGDDGEKEGIESLYDLGWAEGDFSSLAVHCKWVGLQGAKVQ